MQLISQTAVEGRQGPKFAARAAPPDASGLTDLHVYAKGQPYELYRALLEQAPVVLVDEPISGAGYWALTRYADVMKVNGDPQTFSSQRGGILMVTPRPEQGHPLLTRASLDATADAGVAMLCGKPPAKARRR